MNKTIKIAILLIALSAGIALGVLNLTPPSEKSVEKYGVSVERMVDDIRVISEKEHSVMQPENRKEVRDYIAQNIRSLNLEAELFDYTQSVTDYEGKELEIPLTNVFVKIQGRNDMGLMLVAHYDSRGVSGSLNPATDVKSRGAADDGYGITTMLEVARVYAGKDLENSIYLLFTDLEEVGLYGAKKAAANMDLSNVNMVINLEARGIKGPVYMFETADKNYETVKLFANAKQPFAYSIATAVYRVMPNATDFTPFVNIGKAGMNLAVLDNLYYYHTDRDNFDNISRRSLAHYAALIMPIISEYTGNDSYAGSDAFVSDRDGVFFTLFPDVMVLYSGTVATIISLLLLAFVIAIIVYFAVKKEISLKKLLIWSAVTLGAIIAAAAIGVAISFAISVIAGIRFNLTYMPLKGELYVLIIAVAVTAALLILLHKKCAKRFSAKEMLFASQLLLAVLNAVVAFVFVEATFLFTILVAVTIIAFLLSRLAFFHKNSVSKLSLFALSTILIFAVFVPALYAFLMALTVGGIAVCLLLLALAAVVLIPLWLLTALSEPSGQVKK